MSVHRDEAAAWLWLQQHMPVEVNEAMTKLLSVNPQYNGASWWDCLSILRDADYHLDIIEPMVEAMPEWDTLCAFVTLTLIWCSQAFATTYTTDERVIGVRALLNLDTERQLIPEDPEAPVQ